MAINRYILKLGVLVLVLALAVFLFLRHGREKEPPLSVRYTVLFATENDLLSSVSVGDRLTDGVSKGDVGRVESITVSAALAENENGVFPLPHKSRVLLTVVGEGKRQGKGVTIDGMTLLVGKRLSLHGKGLINGVCLSVEIEEAGKEETQA